MDRLSEEEIKVIENLSLKAITSSIEAPDYPNCIVMKKDLQTLLNLIEKQQKELEQEKEKNKELEATLKQTQDSWYEDTKKIELNNECEIALNNRIIDLENELNKEKEKNKKIEEYCRKDFLIF